ncbi:alcohol dehydrogenase catalytic domain-containing protein, partial [Roseibium sp.]|uniref:alcohol dehydrogenase catalytic domain-containing protein n=1 Tax=Roseibium sp. TaxID=1936156 RepID=UPI003D131A86
MSSNQMKALCKSEPREGLWMIRAPVPEIGPDDVLIRINKTGICGTDIHIWNWDDWAAKTVPVPLITGHEFAGEIVELGRNVTDLEIGQRCSGEGHLIGHHSRQSRSGKFHLDPETRGIGVNEQGAFAEYLRLPAFNVVPLPDEIDDEIGAILDPLGNAVHTALSFDLVGEDVLITGAGPIGIMAAAVARHVGARNVVITDINQARLDLATKVADVVPVNSRNESERPRKRVSRSSRSSTATRSLSARSTLTATSRVSCSGAPK